MCIQLFEHNLTKKKKITKCNHIIHIQFRHLVRRKRLNFFLGKKCAQLNCCSNNFSLSVLCYLYGLQEYTTNVETGQQSVKHECSVAWLLMLALLLKSFLLLPLFFHFFFCFERISLEILDDCQFNENAIDRYTLTHTHTHELIFNIFIHFELLAFINICAY